jgi:hypothetical protein
MTRVLWATVASVLVLSVITRPAPQAQTYLQHSCQMVSATGYATTMMMDTNAVIRPRVPSASAANGSPACKAAAARLEQQWEAEDLAQWEPLANRACSAMNGWVEYTPGTCQAGGPPPICKANHWYQDPLTSVARWRQDNAKKYREREDVLIASTCDCWVAEARDDISRMPQDSAPSQAGTPSSYVVPCSGTCDLPGMDCRQGICQPQTTFSGAVKDIREKGQEVAVGQALGYAMKPLIDAVEHALTKVVSATTSKVLVGVVEGLLESRPVSVWTDTYERDVRDLNAHMSQLRGLIATHDRLARAQNAATQQWLTANEIRSVREETRTILDNMNVAFGGIKGERTLGRNACYGILEYQNSLLNVAAVRLLNAPLPAPPPR